MRSAEDTKPREAGTASTDEASGAGSDRIDLSPRAREMHLLGERLEAEPEVRQALVAELREQIRTGRYAPDGRAIADALLEEAGDDSGE
jgi:flagellar biosynthesis anti-sigma factor FlgM